MKISDRGRNRTRGVRFLPLVGILRVPAGRDQAKLALVALALAAIAGCGNEDGPKVATAEQPRSATATASPAASVSAPPSGDYEKALAYTRCMTQNGAVTPDPVEGEPLVTYNRITRGETAEVLMLRYEAHAKCKQLLPDTWPIRWPPEEIARSRAYLACMREQGIPMADPDANGIVNEPTDDRWQTTPEYDAAVAACRHLVDDPANDQANNG